MSLVAKEARAGHGRVSRETAQWPSVFHVKRGEVLDADRLSETLARTGTSGQPPPEPELTSGPVSRETGPPPLVTVPLVGLARVRCGRLRRDRRSRSRLRGTRGRRCSRGRTSL